MCMHHHRLLGHCSCVQTAAVTGVKFSSLGSWVSHVKVPYSDSPHCSDYFHPAAGATHLQTANVLQNERKV